MLMLEQTLIAGVLIGSVYGLFSVGLTLVFGVLRVVNFAHGEFVMFGMFAAYLIAQVSGGSVYSALPALVLLTIPLGLLVYVLCFRGSGTVAGRHDQLIASLGLSIILQNIALAAFGADPKSLGLDSGTWYMGELYFPQAQVVAFVVAVALTVLVERVLSVTQLGRGVRAVVADREVARLLGINVTRLFVVTFVASITLAGIAGGVLAAYYPITPNVGAGFILIAFICVILGGIGDITGAFVAGILVGVVQTLTATYVGTAVQGLIVYALFAVVAIARPRGLLGRSVA